MMTNKSLLPALGLTFFIASSALAQPAAPLCVQRLGQDVETFSQSYGAALDSDNPLDIGARFVMNHVCTDTPPEMATIKDCLNYMKGVSIALSLMTDGPGLDEESWDNLAERWRDIDQNGCAAIAAGPPSQRYG